MRACVPTVPSPSWKRTSRSSSSRPVGSALAGRADDIVGWSSWQVPGEGSWRGLLLVLAAFGSDERSLTMRMEQATTENGDGGSTSSSLTAYQLD